MILKRDAEPNGELIVDNGGVGSSGWSTPLPNLGILHLKSFSLLGGARFFTQSGLRVTNGDPSQFLNLINSNYLSVGSLVVSNTWVFDPVLDLSIANTNGVIVVSALCQPQKTYLLLATTNLITWIPVSTNIPAGSSFDFVDIQNPIFTKRFFRGVMLDLLFESFSIGLNPTNRQAVLMIQGAQPGHTLVLEASGDLVNWTPIATNSPVVITNWQFSDLSSPGLTKRFYRVIGQ